MFLSFLLLGSKGDEQNDEKTLPFQVQIKYKSLDGQQCLRVLTESRLVTTDKMVANKGKICVTIIPVKNYSQLVATDKVMLNTKWSTVNYHQTK